MKRRKFLGYTAISPFIFANPKMGISNATERTEQPPGVITLFLCGDLMTGRGIDQILPHPGDPRIYEPYVRNAKHYVEIAEEANGPIPKPVDYSYIWGDALKVLEHVAPDVRIINLETSVTRSNGYWQAKGIHYRMHPENIPCITAAGIDCCVLANNHVLDWGYEGLEETLQTLQGASLKAPGAGRNLKEAHAPAIIEVAGKGRVVVFSFGSVSSGIPSDWAAGTDRPGINLLPDFSDKTISVISEYVKAVRQAGDIVVASIHWGENWGYDIPREHNQFAHKLIDIAGIDVVHGHSSHHAIGIEVYHDKPITYGCGDFLTDYEGIPGYEQYRDDLALMYFVRMAPKTGKLVGLEMVPTQIRRFRSNRAREEDARWLRETLSRECRKFKGRIELTNEKTLVLHW